jgi:hypothetical protein
LGRDLLFHREIKDTVQQAYAAIATGASTRHRPTALSDSEIDKAWAHRRAMSLEDAAAHVRTWGSSCS